MKIFGWHNMKDGCYYYRMKLPLEELRRQGHEVELSSRVDTRQLDDVDVIVGQRVAQPQATQMWQRLAQAGKHRLVYEIDDDFWNIDPSSEVAYKAYPPAMLANMETCARTAHMVTVTTPHLAEVMSKFNDNVVILPNYVQEALLTLEPDLSVIAEDDRGLVRIGWGGSPTHKMDLDFARDQLVRVFKRNPNTLMYFLGAVYPDKFPAGSIRHAGWADDLWDYYRMVSVFNIGIAPLRPHAFNRAKSYVKALEYAALGIPAVVSAEPSYVDFVQHGTTGFLVRQDHEWGKYLGELIRDQSLRETIGKQARQYASAWTVEGNVYRWSDAYQSLL